MADSEEKKRLVEFRHCPKCKIYMPENDIVKGNFCGDCGTKLEKFIEIPGAKRRRNFLILSIIDMFMNAMRKCSTHDHYVHVLLTGHKCEEGMICKFCRGHMPKELSEMILEIKYHEKSMAGK